MLPDGFRRFASVTLIPGSALASLPKAGAGCSNAACPDLRRGLWATMIPTPTASDSKIPGKFLTRPYWTKVQYTAQLVFARHDNRLEGFSESSAFSGRTQKRRRGEILRKD